MKRDIEKDTVIGVLKHKRDLPIAIHDKWYRIPVKSAPIIVRDMKIRYLALYQGKQFKDYPSQIQWYGEVGKITIHKRIELFPDEEYDPNANEDYFRIEFTEVHKLSEPIRVVRPRRIHFITTAFERFIRAQELNDVFLESPIEERFWEALKSEDIDAERQFIIDYPENKQQKFYVLDFAIFCRIRNIDLECNGDKHHYEKKEDVKKDQRRNRVLTKKGWAVLRYTKDEINNKIEFCINELKETVDKYGGLQDRSDPSQYRLLSASDQLRLF